MDPRIKGAIIGGIIGLCIAIGISAYYSFSVSCNTENCNIGLLIFTFFGYGVFMIGIAVIPLALFGLIVGWIYTKKYSLAVFILLTILLIIMFVVMYWAWYKIKVPNYENESLSYCESLKKSGERFVCVGEKLKNINSEECSTLQSMELQGFCYLSIAIEKKDQSLCDKVLEKDKEYCNNYFKYLN